MTNPENKRPHIICHMHTMLNGKVDGIANISEPGMASQREYHALILGPKRRFTKHRGWLSGAATSRAILGDAANQTVSQDHEPVPAGDYLANPDAQFNYFAIDASANLTWDRSEFEYYGVHAHIVELIPNSASDAFKAHLRAQGVSYIIAGEDTLDLELAVKKIGEIYQTDELILGGGPTINWSMIRAGLVDELSLVLMPVADAQPDTSTLFESNERFSAPAAYAFDLTHVEKLNDGSVWLRYNVTGPTE